jgi:hypothetical protein
MAEPTDTETPHPCSCGETHKGHICWLTRMGMFMELQHLSDAPTVKCSKCGARANQPHNVCFPVAHDH